MTSPTDDNNKDVYALAYFDLNKEDARETWAWVLNEILSNDCLYGIVMKEYGRLAKKFPIHRQMWISLPILRRTIDNDTEKFGKVVDRLWEQGVRVHLTQMDMLAHLVATFFPLEKLMEKTEEDMANGNIKEGEYLDTMNRLRDLHKIRSK
jgi:hypothetical protein